MRALSKRIERIFDLYGVVWRAAPQAVRHQTYGFTTVVDPDGFAVFEAALKSVYISNVVWFKVQGLRREFMNSHAYYGHLFRKNGIDIPGIAEDWGAEETRRAAEDYHYCAAELGRRTGQDQSSGEARDLYYALLD